MTRVAKFQDGATDSETAAPPMPDLAAIFARHDNAVLAFSGGKDSLVCLHLCRPYRDKLTVVWVNTGAMFPHIIGIDPLIAAMRMAYPMRLPLIRKMTDDQYVAIARRDSGETPMSGCGGGLN